MLLEPLSMGASIRDGLVRRGLVLKRLTFGLLLSLVGNRYLDQCGGGSEYDLHVPGPWGGSTPLDARELVCGESSPKVWMSLVQLKVTMRIPERLVAESLVR